MWVQQNGIDLDTQPDKYQRRCQSDPSKVEDFWIEHIGIITAAPAHKDKAQHKEGQTNGHGHIIFSVKDQFRFLGLVWGVPLFLHTAKLIIKIVCP